MSSPHRPYSDAWDNDRAAEIEEAWMFGTAPEIGRRANPCRHVMRYVRTRERKLLTGDVVQLHLRRCRACGFEEWD